MPRLRISSVALLLLAAALACQAPPARADLPEGASEALKRAASFYRESVASHGGYVYYYSLDLKDRWGEGKCSADTIFVEPPGTPTVGLAYLKAYDATGDRFYLDAVRETAEALVHGQLESGGWAQVIHFAKPERGRLGKYRKGRPAGSRNNTSFDDGQTQAALEFLAQADKALGFQHAEIHEAAMYGFDALLNGQFANGAFPQVMRGPASPQPVREARFPDYDWKTERRVKNYWDYYTLNDDLAGDMAQTLIVAHQVYQDGKYEAALRKLGDFLLLAQMPEPQPGWCQQYSYEMYPMWARKFEPPAIVGAESKDAMRTLIRIAEYTGEEKYLEPIPRALEYFKACVLPDGQLARYYELGTNKPLFMNQNYELTYDDSAAPSHYSWKQPARLERIEKAYQAATKPKRPAPARSADKLAGQVRWIIRQLDDHGRWVSTYSGKGLTGSPRFPDGFQYISSKVFSRNVETLSEYIALQRQAEQ